MERFYRNVSASEIPLGERPEVFKAICVDLAANVAIGMIDRFVDV